MSSHDDGTRERRGPYRQAPSSSQPLSAMLEIPDRDPVLGELLDLTAVGAGVRVPFATDPNLSIGDVIEVTIGSMMRTPVETPARVLNVAQPAPGFTRYGLEFINVGNLYSQLDSFYARFFNRRRHPRVRPVFDQVLRVELAWASADLTARVYDVSESGMALTLPRSFELDLELDGPVSIRFQLPHTGAPVEGLARVHYDVQLEKRRLAGIEYDLESPKGMSQHLPAIREYVAQRTDEMAAWERAWSASSDQ